MDPVIHDIQATVSRTQHTTLFTDEESAAAARWFTGTEKKFVAFLSHHKEACASEARLVKGELDNFFEGEESFLDSDNLHASVFHESVAPPCKPSSHECLPSPRLNLRCSIAGSA